MTYSTISQLTINTAFRQLRSDSETVAASLVKIYPLNAHEGLITLPDRHFTIGRDAKSDLWIDESSISRMHARIEPVDAGFLVRDLNSTNGTYVNDKRVESVVLKAGDQVRFGNHIYKVLGENDLEAQFLEAVYTRMIRDGLTGIYNKRYLQDALERDLTRSQRHNRPLSVAMLDIDHFKKINDSYGHLVGDEVLREFSRRISQTLRQDDIFARCGGEEFVVVLNETPVDQARLFAEQCRRSIGDVPFANSESRIPVTVSIGIATAAAELTPEQLLAVADSQLYTAKNTGRNRVCG